MTRPWPPGSATGIGSLPGTDPDEAVRLVLGELPDLPHLPELPARGVGAEMIGRAAALLVDLPVEVGPTSWRIASRPGRDLRRARDLMARDLDALEQHAAEYSGALKVQVTGAWTLAAGVELPSGHRVLTDAGAARDLVESLAEGVREHLAAVRARVPAASLVLQLDEPSLPAVLAGSLPTASGYGTVRAVEATLAEQVIRDVLGVAPEGGRAVHCCAPDVPITLLRTAGANAIAVDASLLSAGHYDELGEAVEAGVSLWLGVLPTSGRIDKDAARASVVGLWRTLGFAPERLAESVVVTPACGLAGADPDFVRRALTAIREVGRSLTDVE